MKPCNNLTRDALINLAIEDLEQCYLEAKPLIKFITDVRGVKGKNDLNCRNLGKKNVQLKEIQKLFEKKTLWEDIASRTGTGHRKWHHLVSNFVIEYSNHQDPVDPGAIMTLVEKIQEHLNFFRNEIFQTPWKEENKTEKNINPKNINQNNKKPDCKEADKYKEAAKRLIETPNYKNRLESFSSLEQDPIFTSQS